MNGDASANLILEFWFGQDRPYGARRSLWFSKQPGIDAEVGRRFSAHYQRAVAGELDAWRDSAEGCLALVLLLDQFPRNMFRGTPRAFAADPLARKVAGHGICRGFDQALPPVQRMFFYLPFEHSENLPDQERAVALTAPFKDISGMADVHEYALRHRDVIARFGRFPHRNAILGRACTPEEEEFLKQPGSRF